MKNLKEIIRFTPLVLIAIPLILAHVIAMVFRDAGQWLYDICDKQWLNLYELRDKMTKL